MHVLTSVATAQNRAKVDRNAARNQGAGRHEFLYSTYIVFNPSNCKMGVWGETHLIVVKNSTCTLVRKGGNRDFNDIGKKISIQIKMNKKIAPL